MKNILREIVVGLVDEKDQVIIKEIAGEQVVILEINVAAHDRGKVIGRQGKTITAIRHIIASIASRDGIRVNVEVIEPH